MLTSPARSNYGHWCLRQRNAWYVWCGVWLVLYSRDSRFGFLHMYIRHAITDLYKNHRIDAWLPATMIECEKYVFNVSVVSILVAKISETHTSPSWPWSTVLFWGGENTQKVIRFRWPQLCWWFLFATLFFFMCKTEYYSFSFSSKMF